jgi:hypothetical protein
MTTHTGDITPLEPNCPDCDAGIGQAHDDRCDVARCLATGLQRLGHPPTCPCPPNVWTGQWPGTAECEEFGWMLGPDLPDLNRLLATAIWDPAARRWTRPDIITTTADGQRGGSVVTRSPTKPTENPHA